MKKYALLITGRFFFTDFSNNFLDKLQKTYHVNNFDIYLYLWKTDELLGKRYDNNIEKILSFYNPKKYAIGNIDSIRNVEIFNSSFDIMVYQRKKVFDLIESDDYDGYITIRPEICYANNLDLNNINIKDDIIYCYSSPEYASSVCYNFCDWFYMGNYNTIKKLTNIDYKYNSNFSNEKNFKINYLNNNINIDLLGTVGNDIEIKTTFI